MQNDYDADSGSGASDHQEDPNAQPANTGFIISKEDSVILEEYVVKFKDADTAGRTILIEEAMGRLYGQRPENAPFNKIDARMKIQKWLHNRNKSPRHQYIKFTRKWSARNAFYHLNRDEVLQLTGEVSGTEPGDPAFLGSFQNALTTLWKDLSPEDQEDYVKAAKEWSDDAPPKHIQSRMAASMRGRIIRDFQRQLYKTCGIRTLILTAYQTEDKELSVGLEDGRTAYDDGKDFMRFCPDWKNSVLWDEWLDFGKDCFAKDTAHGPPTKDRSKTIATRIPIQTDQDGRPELPTVTMANGYKTKVVQSMLREYCTAHIQSVTGLKKQIIPWGQLVKEPTSWMVKDCIPHGFEWKDPSKIQVGEVFRLLDHWRDREAQDLVPLIWMPTCPLLLNVGEPQRRERKVRRARALQIQDADSDEEVFHLEEIDEDEDEENEDYQHKIDNEDYQPEVEEPLDKSSTEADASDGGKSDSSQSQKGGHPTVTLDVCGPSASLKNRDIRLNTAAFTAMPRPSAMPGQSNLRQVQRPAMETVHQFHTEKGKRPVKVSEKARNLDSGRGTAGVDAKFLLR